MVKRKPRKEYKKVRRTFAEIEAVVSKVKKHNKGTEFLALCPLCKDETGHLSIKQDGGDGFVAHCVRCDAKTEDIIKYYFPIDNSCDDWEIEELKKLRKERMVKQESKLKSKKAEPYDEKIVAEYEYKDVEGNLVYTKQKIEHISKKTKEPIINKKGKIEKTYKIFNANREKGIARLENGKPVISVFNLDKLAKASYGDLIFIVEGEKDCQTLEKLGYVAITTYGGGGSKVEFNEVERRFLSKHKERLVIIPDNDKVGKTYINNWKEYKPTIIDLKDLWDDCPEGSDITDFLNNSNNNYNILLEKIKKILIEKEKDILPFQFEIDEVKYKVDFNGITEIKSTKKYGEISEKICYQPIIVEKAYVIKNDDEDDEEKNEELMYLLKYWFSGRWHEKTVNAMTLRSIKRLSECCGKIDINVNIAKKMIDYFTRYRKYYRIDDDRKFIATNYLFIDEEEKFIGLGSPIKLLNDDLSKALGTKGTWEEWKKAGSQIWQDGSKQEVFEFSKLGISICTHLMKDLTPIFEAVGNTGIGKTVLMEERISMYGNPARSSGLLMSGNTTLKNVYEKIGAMGYLPLELDEGELLRNSPEITDDKSLNNFMYSLTQGQSRGRLQRDQEKDDYKSNKLRAWYTVINITSESTLKRVNTTAGQLNRMITVQFNKGDVNLKHQKVFRENYGWFIREIEKSKYFNKKSIEEYIDEEKNFLEIEGYKEIASKQKNYFKYLSFTIFVFNILLGETKYKIDDFVEFFEKEEDIDLIDKYIEDIYNLINSRQQKFFDTTDGELRQKTLSVGDVWGVITEDYIYVDKNKLERFFEKTYRMNLKSIADKLEEKGVIKKYADGKRKKRLSRIYKYNSFNFSAIRISKNASEYGEIRND